MKIPTIDQDYLIHTLGELIAIPSPSGYTDQVVRYVSTELEKLGVGFELTRRGAIRAHLKGKNQQPSRAVVSHVDTLGAMTRGLKENGRLAITPIGFWSSRFAEGARVTIFTDQGPQRGSILPLKASGHTYNEEIDTQPVNWDQVEVRVDEKCESKEDLLKHNFNIGDWISIDPNFEITKNGFISSRHLDNKAGVASLLAAVKAIKDNNIELPIDCNLLFTISEEVGSGASAVLHDGVSEMLSIDNSTLAPDQNSNKYGVTVAIKDSSGPFDYHFTRMILDICKEHNLVHSRDTFRYYRCDAASAIEAGNDIRTALVCFACDASHGYERTHVESLLELGKLLSIYMQKTPTFMRDKNELTGLKEFSIQPTVIDPSVDPEGSVRSDTYDDE